MSHQESAITGKYRITSMEMWDQEFVDADVPGFIEFSKNGLGKFQFGYVRCDIDWDEGEHDGSPAIEFSFQGFDEMEPISGRGWAKVDGRNVTGEFMFFQGDDSTFTATRA